MSARPNSGGEDRNNQPDSPERRRFLTRVSAALGGIAAAVIGGPIIGFLISPLVRREPDVWRPVGAVDDFPLGATVLVTFLDADPLPWAGFAAQNAAFIRREGDDQIVAFSIYCTHVGCPVRWEEGAQMFMCPCHGGAFFRDGRVAVGPPTRPLVRFPVRVREGQVEILTTAVVATE